MKITLPLLWLCYFFTSTFAYAKELRLCYETDSAQPYGISSAEDMLITGNIFIDRIGQAVENAGFKAFFYRRSWGRCIQDLISGANDVIFPTVWMKGREQWGRFPRDKDGRLDNSRSIRKAIYRVYTPANSQVTWDGKEFSALSSGIGAPYGYVVYHMLKNAGYLSPIDLSVEEGFKMLALNRLNGYVVEEQVADALIEKEQYQGKITSLPLAFHISYFHLLLSHQFYRRDPGGAEKLWDELKRTMPFALLPHAPASQQPGQER
ncbi:hypothetical protein [Thalassomonas haliotis]|uniref:Solute-binding protein family 3/N-terminal domain-containing protein n=1 Tax=Thalassomonas haliotis TaxID=485448 RepID=A0ABY7VA93_9GAMM|nr:hypothetical protein [Thalassomonas haliotis]WDE10562.1 hypothetical protein H3N35_20200 [Thalassomonas haliotis]